MARFRSVVLCAVLLFGRDAWSQYAPIGSHHASLRESAPAGLFTIGANGAYRSGIPMDFPAPRGNLPVPLSVGYDGSSRVSDVGVGWSIPFTYVAVSRSASHRKPTFVQWIGVPVPPQPVEATARIFLSMDGQSSLMNPVDDGLTRYHPMTGASHFEIESRDGRWIGHDLKGLVYTFSAEPQLNDDSLFLLKSIQDPSGANHVDLEYRVLMQGAAPEILLGRIAYSHAPDGSCPKYEIELGYETPFGAPGGTVLGYSFDRGRVRVHTQVVTKVIVWSHKTLQCGKDPSEILRSYDFRYGGDPETGLPRLKTV